MEEEPLEDSNSRTPLIILGVATAVLVIVGIMSFTKFVAAQKDPGNQIAEAKQLNKPLTPEDRVEYERQQLSQQLKQSRGVVTNSSGTQTSTTEPKKNEARGRVVDFSEEWNFVTLDIGTEQEVEVGDEFYVARDEIIKGVIKVDQVSPTQSIAVFVTENDFSAFLAPKKGDEIRDIK